MLHDAPQLQYNRMKCALALGKSYEQNISRVPQLVSHRDLWMRNCHFAMERSLIGMTELALRITSMKFVRMNGLIQYSECLYGVPGCSLGRGLMRNRVARGRIAR